MEVGSSVDVSSEMREMPSPENMNTLKLPNSVELSDSPFMGLPFGSELFDSPFMGLPFVSAKGLRPHLSDSLIVMSSISPCKDTVIRCCVFAL
jgi:hypothetical protein